MRIRRMIKNTIVYGLILSILSGFFCACGTTDTGIKMQYELPASTIQTIDTTLIAESITEQIKEEVQASEAANDYTGIVENVDLNYFVYEKVFDEFSIAYDTFDAALKMPDGSEIYGIGYSDFSAYFESDDGSKGFFPAGFIMSDGDLVIPDEDIEKGLEIENLTYNDENVGFVLAYETEAFTEHCVVGGKYIQYGINDKGCLFHTEADFDKDNVDTDLGALYSYDDNRFLYDPNLGEYVTISGTTLFSNVDYDALQTEVNRILDEQDFNFSSVDVSSAAYFAKEAVCSYLLSLQEETFLGCDVEVLIEEVNKLDPMQCLRITPEGNVIIDVEKSVPSEPSALAKWTVGIGCGITVAGSVALGVFVPAASPASGAICGAAVDVFMQVVMENHAVEDINWGKVAVAATSGALMAWGCPLGAGAFTESVAAKTGSVVLSKLAGYGFLTFSNALVSGATEAAFTIIDNGSKEEVFDSFLVGAAIGASCTAVACALGELGHAGINALKESRPDNWFVKLTDGCSTFIGKYQVHLKNKKLESILAPKSVYEASQAGLREYNQQRALTRGKAGGSYKDVKADSIGEYTEVHETPSFKSTGADGSREQANGPSVKLSKEDHHNTASYGNSKEAREYRKAQEALINEGNYHDAIQMDIDDIHSKFGDKYDEGINQMLEYAQQIGWW